MLQFTTGLLTKEPKTIEKMVKIKSSMELPTGLKLYVVKGGKLKGTDTVHTIFVNSIRGQVLPTLPAGGATLVHMDGMTEEDAEKIKRILPKATKLQFIPFYTGEINEELERKFMKVLGGSWSERVVADLEKDKLTDCLDRIYRKIVSR